MRRCPIAAVGIASMAETGVPLDADGDAAAVPSSAGTATPIAGRSTRCCAGIPTLAARTGIPATTKPTLITLTGLRARQPELFARMAAWAAPADLIAEALTGSRATDHTLAARTMLLGPAGAVGPRPARRARPSAPMPCLASSHRVSRPARPRPEPRCSGSAPASPSSSRATTTSSAHGRPVCARRARWPIRSEPPRPSCASRTPRMPRPRPRTASASDAPSTAPARRSSAAVPRAEPCWPTGRAILRRGIRSTSCRWPTRTTGSRAPRRCFPIRGVRQCPKPDPGARLVVPDGLDEEALSRALMQGLVFHSLWMREAIAGHAAAPERQIVLIGSLAHRHPRMGAARRRARQRCPVRRCTALEPVASGAALLAAVRAGAVPADAVLAVRIRRARSTHPASRTAHRRFLDAVEANIPTEGAP